MGPQLSATRQMLQSNLRMQRQASSPWAAANTPSAETTSPSPPLAATAAASVAPQQSSAPVRAVFVSIPSLILVSVLFCVLSSPYTTGPLDAIYAFHCCCVPIAVGRIDHHGAVAPYHRQRCCHYEFFFTPVRRRRRRPGWGRIAYYRHALVAVGAVQCQSGAPHFTLLVSSGANLLCSIGLIGLVFFGIFFLFLCMFVLEFYATSVGIAEPGAGIA